MYGFFISYVYYSTNFVTLLYDATQLCLQQFCKKSQGLAINIPLCLRPVMECQNNIIRTINSQEYYTSYVSSRTQKNHSANLNKKKIHTILCSCALTPKHIFNTTHRSAS